MTSASVVTIQQLRVSVPSDSEFLRLAAHLKEVSGINLELSEKNLALMSSRLQKLRGEGIGSYKDMIAALDRGDVRSLNLFICAMTTNTTHFFREVAHFDILAKVIKERVEASGGTPELRVWCAASSTGEEPYALAMALHDLQTRLPFMLKMLATDIDFRVLATAKAGIYSDKQVEGIPPVFLQRYFRRVEADDGVAYQVTEALRSVVQFGRFNLLKNYPFKGKFDVIFCRNVLIYFDRRTVELVVGKLTGVLKPGGYLFLGHSEAIAGMAPGLRRAGPAVYRRV